MIDRENKKWTVYIHTNKINQKRYVGITSRNVKQRWGRNGERYKGCDYFYRAIKKWGWDNFYHTIYEANLSEEDAKATEILLIKMLRTQDRNFGYNLADGGAGHPCPSRYKIPIYQFTLDGDYVGEYPSLTSAAKEVNSKNIGNITEACKKRKYAVYGYCWRYKSDCQDLDVVKQEILEQKENIHRWHVEVGRSGGKRVCQLDTNGNLIATYDSIGYAAENCPGANADYIANACRNNYYHAGYRWLYEIDYEKMQKGEIIFQKKPPSKRAILQFDKNGKLKREYSSVEEIKSKYNSSQASNIIKACSQHNSSQGYYWRYKDDYKDTDIVVKPSTRYRIPVVQFDLYGNFIAKYDSIFDTIKALESNNTSAIGKACKSSSLTVQGFVWRLEKDCERKSDGTYITLKPFISPFKAIFQFSKDGTFIKKFMRTSDAVEATGVDRSSIKDACIRFGSTGGFLFRYQEGCEFNDDGTITPKFHQIEYKHVAQFSEDKAFIREYSSAKDASQETNIDKNLIRSACNKKNGNRSNGYRWKWTTNCESSPDGSFLFDKKEFGGESA